MSLIRNWNATPNRVSMFLDFIKHNKNKYTKKDLENIFTPHSSSFFKELYQVIEMLDFVVIEEDIVKSCIKNKKISNLEIIKNAIFTINNEKLESFNIALSWFLMRSPKDSISFSDNVGNYILRDLSDQISVLELTNTASWQQFVYWCEYLGFVKKVSISGETFICPDPTQAIKNELELNFKKGERIPVKDFFVKLSSFIPILEYGVIREKVNSMLRDGLSLPNDTLSYSSSLAIIRLEQQKIISIESKSDAEVVTLLDGTNNKRISHIKYLG